MIVYISGRCSEDVIIAFYWNKAANIFLHQLVFIISPVWCFISLIICVTQVLQRHHPADVRGA